MNKERRSNVAFGIVLILLGAIFLSFEFFPGLADWIEIEISWPLIVIGVGIFLLLLGLLVKAPGMAVPACIVGGIGGILYYQNATDSFDTWSYAWTLIPGFVGVGIVLAGILDGEIRKGFKEGFWPIIVSAVLFAIFYSMFSGVSDLWQYWPILVILLGLWVLFSAIFRKK